MTVPTRDFGDLLVTDWAKAPLFFPQVQEPSFSPKRADHVHIKPFLEVGFPGRIVRIGLRANFRVPLDANRVGGEQAHHFDLPFFPVEDSRKHPPVRTGGRPVFLLDPPARFVGVSSLRPNPQGFEDFMIDRMKDILADHMAVIQGPSTNLRIQFGDQFSCRQVSPLLDVLSDLGKEGLDVLLGGSNEELGLLSFLVLAYRLPKKIKSLLDMRDDGFLR